MSLPSRLAIATAATIARVGSSSHSLPSLSLAATQCAVAAASIAPPSRRRSTDRRRVPRGDGPRRGRVARPAQRPQRSRRLGRAHVARSAAAARDARERARRRRAKRDALSGILFPLAI